MRTMFMAAAALLATTVSSEAGCRTEGVFPGKIAARSTEVRTLTLSPKYATIGIIATDEDDKLYLSVRRPSGAVGCAKKGPASANYCVLTVKSRGIHKVIITNRMRRAVDYKMSCFSN